MDWYPWYFELYKADTMHLDPYQDGCYRRLIDHYMGTRQPLPDNDAALARIVGDSLANWVAMASAIVRPFFKAKNGLLYHKKCDEILNNQDKKAKRLSESGKKGASKRWQENKDLDSPAMAPPLGSAIAEENRGDVFSKENTTPTPPDEKIESGKKGGAKTEPSPPEIQMALSIYNEVARKKFLPIPNKLTDGRKSKLKARLKDAGGLEGWRQAMQNLEASAFLCGHNDKGWKADIDFILQEKSFTRLIEGFYAERKAPHETTRNSSAGGGKRDRAIEAVQRGLDAFPDPERDRFDPDTGEILPPDEV